MLANSKRILIILGHPRRQSFCAALAEAYATGAQEKGAELQLLALGELEFDAIAQRGYAEAQTLEPDLLRAQEAIRWAKHLVFVYPTWWGSLPAILKGFIERVFLPGFAFRYRDGSPLWDKLLKGKSARIITTMGSPVWYYKWVYRSPGHRLLRTATLEFSGVSPVRCVEFGGIRRSKPKQRSRYLQKVQALGRGDADALS